MEQGAEAWKRPLNVETDEEYITFNFPFKSNDYHMKEAESSLIEDNTSPKYTRT